MSKTTKTEMVAEMKSGNTDKDNKAEEGRSLRESELYNKWKKQQ